MGKNIYKIGDTRKEFEDGVNSEEAERAKYIIEPWLSALCQSEHLSLLLGNGFTTGAAVMSNAFSAGMAVDENELDLNENVMEEARRTAELAGRGRPNLEDQIRSMITLIKGLEMIDDHRVTDWKTHLNEVIRQLLKDILVTEEGIKNSASENHVEEVLSSFILSFASRTASRERLNIYTTNYDRLIEYISDLLGLRLIDRFVGSLNPIYRSSKLGIDMHYNPPGIRGEPRYLEGVARYTKLHGSIDWKYEAPYLRRYGIPFGASVEHNDIPESPAESVMIYPNPAKDVETLEYPYADLFRDFATGICQPNSVLITYGYGFGDDHINRVIRDMLTVPSTHLVIISFDDAGGRITNFIENIGKDTQMTLLIGDHFGNIEDLVKYYLPKPAIDYITSRQAQLLEKRSPDYKENFENIKNENGGEKENE
ncbi:SIR2 family protein [Salicibibacter kimchii]|uniref:Fibronectin-binding protein (FBP) n=1 Tax=Salicibibacter kimchii TaxID=2099786 RepID=A0A345BWH1_9BACI|nr:SIR2 family protein [Salicibibacter kimchii]AXF55302.1 fibronectin-binding protein (FBP) [Salicibibacter kimchii]